jgi:hypothetical protein
MFSFPWWLSLWIGFLSLSEEILWVRVLGFSYETLPFAFSFVLACYLVGIALGAAYGKRLCARSPDLYAVGAVVLAVAAVGDAVTPRLISEAVCARGHRGGWLEEHPVPHRTPAGCGRTGPAGGPFSFAYLLR